MNIFFKQLIHLAPHRSISLSHTVVALVAMSNVIPLQVIVSQILSALEKKFEHLPRFGYKIMHFASYKLSDCTLHDVRKVSPGQAYLLTE